ncbi:ABC transporter transmembrane domain-containing protein [Sedimentitalea sp. JM2-8]|uniref:ABC transporter transmembrane domain-containing protein n=1 Tax=Sedimentitalea xiamensis TaxID=3050037 RepID=A0ABT7FHY8_9RHOB|nr:ABC transporter transmembrane domain-containing protein [Sedimentitalea xiamensis]MDK3074756.1 ABC transporter transmembrane domain-containing protein [Sedimentitalea xiamensis]
MLFPLLYLTLELPKRIINDAIGSETSTVELAGIQMSQVAFLWVLCAAFLISVLLHGLMKMRINTMKGVLSERMLRRYRYQMISRILRFPQPYFERVSQGELVSMVTAESEPMGGLMGDAISQPVLQGGQMLTILTFLFLQSFWFGLAAIALIPLQAWLIPMLQRQINMLNKDRIKQVRVLASAIGESAAGAATLRSNGGWRYRLAEITDQLGRLFDIRFVIYQKKFFMKFLNNFISQLTPFFFFSIGGYLVLQGNVSLGALVAALAAYKDLSSPWKELLDYYNQTQDMAVRWDIILERFDPAGMVDERLIEGMPDEIPHLTGDIVLDHVSVRDTDGNTVLDDLTVTLPGGKVIAVAAPSSEDRRAFAQLLTREVMPSTGRVSVGGRDLAKLHQAVIAARIGHATSNPVLFQGTFGDNVMMPVKIQPPAEGVDSDAIREAIRAGNSGDPLHGDWTTPAIAGPDDPEALRDWWLQLVEGMGSGTALFQRGLEQRFDAEAHPELAERLVRLRPAVQQAIRDAGLRPHVFFFSPELYNPGLPVAENLLLATPRRPITQQMLAEQTGFIDQLKKLKLDRDLIALSQDVIDLLRQIFGTDGTDHPLFRRLGLDAKTYEAALDLVERSRKGGIDGLTADQVATLLTVPFQITAEQIGPAFPDAMKDRILQLRQVHASDLQRGLGDLFAPLAPDAFAPGLSVQDNALFGKVSDTAGAKGQEIRKLVADVLLKNGMQRLVIQLVYDLPIALGGTNLPTQFAEPLALGRATIKRPDILIMDRALASYDMATQVSVHNRLRGLLPESTLVYLNEGFEREAVFDAVFELRQGRIVSGEMPEGVDGDSVASADLARKLRALEQTDMFSGLNRKQLRLLAFGARWFQAEKGDVVFSKGDAPTDGAYVLLEGEADLILPKTGEQDQLIATVGPGTLVGELGLIRDEPRALSMVAATDLKCLRLGAEEFLAVVENDAATAFKLLQVVAGYVNG